MSSPKRDSKRIVIAGASSLLGVELKSLLEESRFAGWDFRLVDEVVAAGTLTEAGGEPMVIQPVEEGSFARARFVFFTGSPEFTRNNLEAAHEAGTVIDLSGAMTQRPMTAQWFPMLEVLGGVKPLKDADGFAIPSAAATAASTLELALKPVGLRRLAVICFQPISEAGRAGIEELESQTAQLLAFQNVGKPVFDTQVAFALLDRFGVGGSPSLAAARERVRAEVKACVAGKVTRPAVQLVHAPVFYGTVFSACSELDGGVNSESIVEACKNAGFGITEGEEGPSNVSAAGQNVIQLAVPEPDPAQAGTWWFWGAADNIRLPAWNAVKLAEKLAG